MPTFEPDRALLNPKFEGYKLSPIEQDEAVWHYPLEYKPSQTNVSGRSHVTFQEVASRIRHNHLTVASEGSRAVYFDGDLRIISIALNETTLEPSLNLLYELPNPIQSPTTNAPQREYPSACLVDASSLFVSDGYGTLYALQSFATGPAQLLGVFELSIPSAYGSSATTVPFRIHQAVQTKPGEIVVILSSKHYPANPDEQKDLTQSRGKHVPPVFDIWAVRFALPLPSPHDQPQPMNIIWHRQGEDVPTYTAYDEARKAFLLVGGSPYRPIEVALTPTYEPSPDEIAPIPRAGENLDGGDTSSAQPPRPPPYSWTQTSDSVTVAIPLPSTTKTENIKVTFSPRTLTVLVQGEPMMDDNVVPIRLPRFALKALWDGIHPGTSLWTFDRSAEHSLSILTLHLDKQHEDTRWPQVFASAGTRPPATGELDDTDIEVPETLDPSELYAIRESLEKYTAALRDGTDASGLGLGRGLPSLAEGEIDDEVDTAVGHTACLTWVGAEGVLPSWAGKDGHGDDGPLSVLSTPFPGAGAAMQPSLVVKNGLDGLVYSLEAAQTPENPPKWVHSSTFSALSFVLASKRDTRFTHHFGSEAVLAFDSGSRETGGNVFIYRGTGPREKWAKQAVLTVGGGTAGSLLGVGLMRLANGKVVILCLCEGELNVLRAVV
ncbi:hypothetical protein CERSUDRAFT_103862 [Gelatoporia subvermispora B]|uniref:NudC domain-containing protein 1 n=1 Tax=Ceriporiopsis subvermispora (strain B) TaxID=914234 RepID=M2RNG1_CERS8|nr:hypothetical protein CERSUDRAFT_103862 [Gelatoporia subvermispora B]